MYNSIHILGGLSLHILGIGHHYVFWNRHIEPLTLFVVDHLSVHDGEGITGIGFLFAQHFVFQVGENEGADNERVSEDKPLDVFIARGFSITALIHEPTVTYRVVFQNGCDVHSGVDTLLGVHVGLGPHRPLC